MNLAQFKVKSNCHFYEVNTINDLKKYKMLCNFNMDEIICKSGELYYYDLTIGEDVDGPRTSDDGTSQSLILEGFNNQNTITVLAGNIAEKKVEGSLFIFTIKNNIIPESLKDYNFPLKFKTYKESDKVFESNCIFEDNDIRCETESESLKTESDIIITEVPNDLILNNKAVYFQKFKDLRTFSIIGGQIEKEKCEEGKDFQFNLINSISIEDILEEKTFEIDIIIINENNKEEIKINKTVCTIKNQNKYSMNCFIKDVNCIKEIMLYNSDLKPNIELYSPHTTYFYDFNKKRTITIRAGKINKGECISLQDDKQEYSFRFTGNEISYNDDKSININLNIFIGDIEKTAMCNLNLSNKENPIICFVDICPNKENDISIKNNPDPSYNSFYPNTIYFDNFAMRKTTTIINDITGMIIKGERIDNVFSFIITENKINENDIIENEFNFELNINKGKAICTVPKVESKDNKFNISCSTSDLSVEDEIEIIEEPEYEEYYFSGYKNKKTISLIPGSIIKDLDNNKFLIIDNNITGEIQKEEIKTYFFKLEIKYNENNDFVECFIEKNEDDDIKISFSIKDPDIDINDIKTVFILNNPEPILLSEKITFYLNDFKGLIFKTITIGKILKDQCNTDSKYYSFILMDTIISEPITEVKPFELPITINNEHLISICTIEKDSISFNMSCIVNNYCPSGNFDIKVEKESYYDSKLINKNTIYFEIPENLQTTTLKAGYITKISCNDYSYEFTINDNIINTSDFDDKLGELNLKLFNFDKEAFCEINFSSKKITCSVTIDKENEKEKEYCENINKDIKIEKVVDNDYIIINDNILYLYGFENLQTYTIEAGDVSRGKCNNNNYEFTISNSTLYNDILNDKAIEFNLELAKPEKLNAVCSLPSNLKFGIVNIICQITNEDSCQIVLDKDLEISENNPIDVIYDSKRINFKNFTKKSSIITISAGMINIIKEENKYYLNFINSNIDFSSEVNISFNIKYEYNKNEQSTICTLEKNDIICPLNDIASDLIHIKILNNPNDNYDYFDTKTIVFTDFADKEIYTLVSGDIERGECKSGTSVYTFNIKNSKSLMNIENGFQFNLDIKYPKKIAVCNINFNRETSLYDIVCNIEGTSSCPIDPEDNYFITDVNEPAPKIINDKSVLYFLSFANKSTIDNNYYLKGGLLTKKYVEKNNDNVLYKFTFKACSINKIINQDINYEITINLDIYDDEELKSKEFNANCKLQSNIPDQASFDIECSFITDNTYYLDDSNYDIQIIKGDVQVPIDDELSLYIFGFDGLSTITLHNCQILKGKCDSSKKYSYTFSSCLLPKEITFDNDLEFDLNAKNDKTSKCKIKKDNKNEILCEIENYSLCDKNDIEIGDNNPEIDYSKYPLLKNFYISGLKNLYTSTLTGGIFNFGECSSGSNDYIYKFKNTQLTKSLIVDLDFNLLVKEPLQINSICTIPKNVNEFDLNCVIKGENECPIKDGVFIKINEITDESRLDLLKPNTIYINNLINRNFITMKAGDITPGKCNEDNEYEFNFTNSEIIGEIKDIYSLDDIKFSLNLKNPNIPAECVFPLSIYYKIINIKCSIKGNNRCPMYDYSYIEIDKNDPNIDEKSISPNILEYSNFKNRKLIFNNYYISISEYINDACVDDNFEFYLKASFKSENIPAGETFTISLVNDEDEDLIANCKFPSDTKLDTSSLIYCIIDKSIDESNLILNFDILFLKDKNINIINLNEKKIFEFNGIQCPIFEYDSNKKIIPKMGNSTKSIFFSLYLKTSFSNNKDIQILYKNESVKSENIIDFNLEPYQNESSYENILIENMVYISKCNTPQKADTELKLNCYIENITDKSSDYFILQDTTDIIKIDENKISLKGIKGLKIENLYKSGDEEEKEEKEKEEEKEEETEKEEEEEEDSTNESSSSSIFLTIIMPIIISLIFVSIVLLIIIYCYLTKSYCFKENDNTVDDEDDDDDDNDNDDNNNKNNKIKNKNNIKNDNEGDNDTDNCNNKESESNYEF